MRWKPEPDLHKFLILAELACAGTLQTPDQLQPWINLGQILIQLGQYDRADSCLRQAISRFPHSSKLHFLLACELEKRDLLVEALFHAEMALELDSQSAENIDSYLSLVSSLNRSPKIETLGSQLFRERVKSLDPAAVLDICTAQLAAQPEHTEARYFKALALVSLGNLAGAREVISVDRWIEVGDLPIPPEYGDGPSFREALEQEIRANPTLVQDPQGTSTRGGLQTNALRQPQAPAVEGLLARIRTAVDAYVRRLESTDPDFARTAPSEAALSAWAVIYDRDGHQRSHIHANGWLSGVYYVAAPCLEAEKSFSGVTVMGDIGQRTEGGGTERGGLVAPPWGTREIEPIPGRLVLFPSYVPHSTLPSGVAGARVVVAFDVVPQSSLSLR